MSFFLNQDRHKCGTKNERSVFIEKAIIKARNHVGISYATGEARKIITVIEDEVNKNRQFCTRLVSQKL